MNTSKKAPKGGKALKAKASPAAKTKSQYDPREPRIIADDEDDEDFDIPLDDDMKGFDDDIKDFDDFDEEEDDEDY